MQRRITVTAAVILWASAIATSVDLADPNRGIANVLLGAAVCATLMWWLERRDGDTGRRLLRAEAAIRSLREGLVLAGVTTPPSREEEPPVRLAA